MNIAEFFRKFAAKASQVVGAPWSFGIACLMVIAWALSGKYYAYSDTWELMINTATTIITFLMVFIIQNSQNRDMKSLHLKMDELIRANKIARNSLISLETMSDQELNKIEDEFKLLIQQKKDDEWMLKEQS